MGRTRAHLLAAALACAVVVSVGFAAGGYGTIARTTIALAVWLVLLGAVLAGVAAWSRPLVIACGALSAYAIWTLLSWAWAPSAERAFLEFARVALFVGIAAAAGSLVRRESVAAITDGLAAGVAVLALVALASRFFPQAFPAAHPLRFAWGVQTRLNYPVGYWTGLGVLVALAFPLLLRRAVAAGPPAARGLAVAAIVPLVAALYLTSTRLGVVVAIIGVMLFFALEPRWATVGAIAVGGGAGAAVVAFLLTRPQLVDGPFTTHDGAPAAAVLLAAAAAAGVGYAYTCARIAAPRPLPQRPRRALLVAVAAVVAIGLVLVHPIDRLHAFTANPADVNSLSVQQHLLTTSSNGRWQLWTSAAHEWRAHPLLGGGAGSFEEWWAVHGSAAYARDAHSLYLEALGELGPLGLLALVVAFGTGLVVLVRSRRTVGRVDVAAVGAAFAAYSVAAGLDWMWEFTIVSVVGVVLLGLLTGPGSGSRRPVAAGRRGVGVAVGTTAVLVLAAECVVLFAALELRASRADAARGELGPAVRAARAARTVEPWASTPYLQLALVELLRGDAARARTNIGDAIRRDPQDWRLRLVAARIASRAGEGSAARSDLEAARRLRPLAPRWHGR